MVSTMSLSPRIRLVTHSKLAFALLRCHWSWGIISLLCLLLCAVNIFAFFFKEFFFLRQFYTCTQYMLLTSASTALSLPRVFSILPLPPLPPFPPPPLPSSLPLLYDNRVQLVLPRCMWVLAIRGARAAHQLPYFSGRLVLHF